MNIVLLVLQRLSWRGDGRLEMCGQVFTEAFPGRAESQMPQVQADRAPALGAGASWAVVVHGCLLCVRHGVSSCIHFLI